jgi:hypothetical protein
MVWPPPQLNLVIIARWGQIASRSRTRRRRDEDASRELPRLSNSILSQRVTLAAKLLELESTSISQMRCSVWQIHPWLALGVVASTAATDAVYVMFNAAVSSRRRVPAATWSSVWYLLSAFAVISYTRNWVYVCFAALGSWIGAYLSMTRLGKPRSDSRDPDHAGPKAPV